MRHREEYLLYVFIFCLVAMALLVGCKVLEEEERKDLLKLFNTLNEIIFENRAKNIAITAPSFYGAINMTHYI